MRKLDRKTNKLLTNHGQHQRHTQIACISPKQEGRRLMQSEEAYRADHSKLIECVDSEETALIQTDKTYRPVHTEQCYRQLEA